ncbi:MAG: glycosyltransferase family 39 protein [Acidobacteria bacterium]|nr:glycosyltransferase family 39 protein [Acidobacteriota bacterium]
MWKRQAAFVAAFVLLLRLPFLDQAILGDDLYYLYGAQHALMDPLHPLGANYAFSGVMVSMQGHPHPPFNVWFLAALLAIFKDVREPVFHLAYVSFSLIAALSALRIAREFTTRPLLATLLFCCAPAFVVNGNSLESDLPLAAFWLLTVALHISQRWLPCALSMIAAALCGYQSIVLVPILWLRGTGPLWLLAVIPATLGAWQGWERLTSGTLPAQVLTGYFDAYGLQRLENKIKNAIGLTGHMAWLVTPLLTARKEWPFAVAPAALAAWFDPNPLCWMSVGAGAMTLANARHHKWLGQWTLLFFAAALALFFAGAARYLLPLTLPIAIIAAERAKPWHVLATAVPGVALAVVNYQHWDAYRQISIPERRVWANGELGFRFYLEAQGAVPLLRSQRPQPGDWVISSQLTAIAHKPGALIRSFDITPALPIRILGLGSKSGFSTVDFGLRPFDFQSTPIDTVTIGTIVEQRPTKMFVTMSDPDAPHHLLAGVHELEGATRWAEPAAVLQLLPPPKAAPVEVSLYLPPAAPGRVVTLKLDGTQILTQTLPGPGLHRLLSPAVSPRGPSCRLEISIDREIEQKKDLRRLAMVLVSAGFR